MKQLINAAKMPFYAALILFILGGAFIFTIILIFTAANGNVKEEAKTIIVLFIIGVPLLALGFCCKNIYSKNNNQVKSIIKGIVAKEYPDATDFFGILILALLRKMVLNTKSNIKRLSAMRKSLL